MTLYHRIGRTISVLIIIITAGVVVFITGQWISTLRGQLGRQAMDQAITISRTKIVTENIVKDNGYIRIQNYIEKIRLETRIQYVHIVDRSLRIYANPDPNLLGHPWDHFYDSHNIRKVMETGEFITDYYSGNTATAVEAVVPVYTEGIVSGAVIVGMLNGRIFQEIMRNLIFLVVFMFLIILCGVAAAYLLSGSIKKSLRGLEPEEISYLLGQRELALGSLKEGIVFANEESELVMFNKSAESLLGLDSSKTGMSADEFFFGEGFLKAREGGDDVVLELRAGPAEYILGRFHPVYAPEGGQLLGIIASFEDLTVARRRAEELTGMHELTQALRAQNHEFMNKLHAVSGMIQLGETDEAVQYISDIAGARSEITGIINRSLKIPAVAGLVLSKYNKAAEKHIEIILSPESILTGLPGKMQPDAASSITGNLIENAIDALSGKNGGRIDLYICGDEEHLDIVVRDNGSGISPEDIDRIFIKGFSTKSKGRGYGLSVVKRFAIDAGGRVSAERLSAGGSEFRVVIPDDRIEDRGEGSIGGEE